jgi:hypothetical protein
MPKPKEKNIKITPEAHKLLTVAAGDKYILKVLASEIIINACKKLEPQVHGRAV